MAKFLDLTGLTSFTGKIKTWATNKFVAKETGKGLSTNDYTTEEKNKLSNLKNPNIDTIKLNGTTLTPDADKAVDIVLSNYLTTSEVRQEIAQATVGIKNFTVQIVDELPSIGEESVLYLLKKTENGEFDNQFEEYVWIVFEDTPQFECIGERKLNLEDYALKTDLPTKVSELQNDSGFVNTSGVTNMITNAMSEIPSVEAITTEEIETMWNETVG